jgi:hypothetical protein
MAIAQSLGFGYTPLVSAECHQRSSDMMMIVAADTLERVIKKVIATHP